MLMRARTTSLQQLSLKATHATDKTGFTLIELLVAIAIAAILAAMAAPSFSQMIANQRTKTLAADLQIALTRARSEALKRNASVMLKPSTDGWNAGWKVMTIDDEQVIADYGPRAAISITGPETVTYRSSGRLSSSSGRAVFTIASSASAVHRCLTIDLSGRPYQRSSENSC